MGGLTFEEDEQTIFGLCCGHCHQLCGSAGLAQAAPVEETPAAAVSAAGQAEKTANTANETKQAAAVAEASAAPAAAGQKEASPQEEKAAEDPRTAEWAKNRPQEDVIEKYSKEYEGQTIVDTVFEGATPLTENTSKAAPSMKTGDMFTVK